MSISSYARRGGFSPGLCKRFGPGKGFFTRCVETMRGKVDDPEAFCAALHHHCLGKWPGEGREHKEMARYRQQIRELRERLEVYIRK